MMNRVPTLSLYCGVLLSLSACLNGGNGAAEFGTAIPVPGLTSTPGRDGTQGDGSSTAAQPRPARSLVGDIESSYVLGKGNGIIAMKGAVTMEAEVGARIVTTPSVGDAARTLLEKLLLSKDPIVDVDSGRNEVNDPLLDAFPEISMVNLVIRDTKRTIFNNRDGTLESGVYPDGIWIQGTSKVHLNPGLYYIANGGFHVMDSAQVTGTNVFIVNKSTKPYTYKVTKVVNGVTQQVQVTNATHSIRFLGDAKVNLSGTTDPRFPGALIHQQATRPLEAKGTCEVVLNGVIYLPAARMLVTGNASVTVNGHFVTGAFTLGADKKDSAELVVGPLPDLEEVATEQ